MDTHNGFTLIELLVLVTVIGVLAAIAVPNFSATIKGNRDIAYANALTAGLALARSEAIKHGNATICAGTTTACPTSASWSNGWVVFTTSIAGAVTLVQTFPATYGASVNSGCSPSGCSSNLYAFNNAGMAFTDSNLNVPASAMFAVCDSRGAAYGHSIQLFTSGSTVPGQRIGYEADGSTLLNCAPTSAIAGHGGGALGVPSLALFSLLLALVGFRKRWNYRLETANRRSDGLRRDDFGIATQSHSYRQAVAPSRPDCDNGFATETVAPTTPQHRGAYAGFSLLEVLIALVILSVGLLGIAGLLSGTLKSNDSAYMRTVATVQAYNIIDRMRANAMALNSLQYVYTMPAAAATAGSSACTGSGTNCSYSQLASYDIAQWEYDLAQNLPQGRGSITTTITPTATTYTVTVRWNDSRANQALHGSSSDNSSSLSVTSG